VPVGEPKSVGLCRRYTEAKEMREPVKELTERYTRQGHATVEELVAAQGLDFPRDPRELMGDFWPEEESLDDFLAAMREWRGHKRTDPAA
jgi:hypothetical protein